ncbi:MAG: hypothetical protein IJU37_04495 [Desulfovibrio sp.]|nr:hypothetical protein [Desulfovibrio sp.]
MKPLNYAILKYLTTVQDASVEDVMTALHDAYGSFRAFTRKGITEILMTASVNGLLEQSRVELDEKGDLRMYFRAHKVGIDVINRYIS